MLLFDRHLDYLASRDSAAGRRSREGSARPWESSGRGTVAIELGSVAGANADRRVVALPREEEEVSVRADIPPPYSPRAEDDQVDVEERPGTPSPPAETSADPAVSGGAQS